MVEAENNFKCPVYMCEYFHAAEDGLLKHYNSEHKDLVQLGLKLMKSKETRQQEKKQKLRMKANRIVLNTEQEDDRANKSEAESSFSEETVDENQQDIYGNL